MCGIFSNNRMIYNKNIFVAPKYTFSGVLVCRDYDIFSNNRMMYNKNIVVAPKCTFLGVLVCCNYHPHEPI